MIRGAARRACRYRLGARRILPPAATFARIAPLATGFGITRLADVTGLDTIGIPVFQAIRPLARSLTVSQGKGATRMAARVSALMEAIELHHAERLEPINHGLPTIAEAAFCTAIAPTYDQPESFDAARARDWCEGRDLLNGGSLRVPHALVSMDFTRETDPDMRATSNGLASGNSVAEATVSALAEVIERDAHVRWNTLPPSARLQTSIDPDTIDDRLGRRLIDRVRHAGFGLRLWDLSDAHGVPSLLCALFELSGGSAMVQLPALGAGAHPARTVALARAITEAAQSRATLIAGSRDDLDDRDYAAPAAVRLRLLVETGLAANGVRDWRSLPDAAGGSPDSDSAWLLDRARASGMTHVAWLDLTDPAHGIAVVKVIVPGLGDHHRPMTREGSP